MRTFADTQDVFVDVLFLAFEIAGLFETEKLDPELKETAFIGSADGDLLNAQYTKGFGFHNTTVSVLTSAVFNFSW